MDDIEFLQGEPGRKVDLPGARLRTDRMPGHWLLARLGKRVLRPGGITMTKTLVTDLEIGTEDDVVELAPGLGLTARLILARRPKSYLGIERDRNAAAWTAGWLPERPGHSVMVGAADDTGLQSGSASVVLGEAMLSMNSAEHKQRIMNEAYRILRPGGRYAIHELLIVPDEVPTEVKTDIEDTLSEAIHVGARPLTESEWCAGLGRAGFTVETVHLAPMHLLRPTRFVSDEGLLRTLKFVGNVIRDHDARQRVLTMRRTFHKYRAHLRAVGIVAGKP